MLDLAIRNGSIVDGSGLPGCNILPSNQTALHLVMAKRPDAAFWRWQRGRC